MKLWKKIVNSSAVIRHNIPMSMEFAGMACDSRKIQPGYLFVAKKGAAGHGEQFVSQAMENGAAAVASDKNIPGVPLILLSSAEAFEKTALDALHGEPFKSLDVTAVTGTKGKTTTAFIMYEYALEAGINAAYIGTIGIYGKKGYMRRNLLTTPDLYALYETAEELVKAGHKHLFLEVSSHALEQNRVYGLKFNSAAFTNLTRDHLDYHGDMEQYYRAKKRLFTDFAVGSAVVNCDDPYGARLCGELKELGKNTTCFGHDQGDLLFEFSETEEGTIARGEDVCVKMCMKGLYNSYNAVTAALLLRASNIGGPHYVFGKNGVPGRLEYISRGKSGIYIDYAHSPDSLEKLLVLVKKDSPRGLVVVFGCTGDRDRGKRPDMARIAEKYGTYVIITSDDPHGEDPACICRETAAGIANDDNMQVIVDRKKAIKEALEIARPGDNIVIAGKGHERFQIFDGYEVPFNDREIVEALLKGGFHG